jgi:hypothetical protein
MVMALLVAAATSLACGRDEPGLSDQAAGDLRADVERVRVRAESGDQAGVTDELTALRRTVERYRSEGQISPDRAAGVLAAVDEVAGNLVLLAPPTSATTLTPTTSTTVRRGGPATEDDEPRKDEDKGKRGEGKEGDED